jgi:hypothetical protein
VTGQNTFGLLLTGILQSFLSHTDNPAAQAEAQKLLSQLDS